MNKILDSRYLSKIENCHASSGTESAILETLKSKKLAKIKKDIKILQETELIEKVIAQFAEDADLIVIGIDEVSEASERGALKHLLIADKLIRGVSKEYKLKIEDIITNVEKAGGEISIMSTENLAGGCWPSHLPVPRERPYPQRDFPAWRRYGAPCAEPGR